MATLTLDVGADGVAIAWLDDPDAQVNTFGDELSDELDQVIETAEADDHIRALLFASRKVHGFSVGADLQMLHEAIVPREGTHFSQRAQAAMNRLAAMHKPTGAAIHGACLGAGLELALACDIRLAADDRRTRLGLPEVALGLLPGAGGTQRLPRLVGLTAALDLLLTGKDVSAGDALALSLVDEVCPAPLLTDIARERVLEARAIRTRRASGLAHRLVRIVSERTGVARKLVLDRARKELRTRTHGNYPAPERIIDVIAAGLEGGREVGLRAEAIAFGELAASAQSIELRRLFFMRRELDREPWVAPGTRARPLGRVGVVGAGLMGAGIAAVTVERAALPVCLADVSDEAVRGGLRAIRRRLDARVARGDLEPFERDRLIHRVGATARYRGFHACDLTIEAVTEDLDTKRAVMRVVQACNPNTIFASNTSALPIGDLARLSAHPEQVIGMHYFSPVARMPLVEIVVTEHTAPEVIATCVELARRQGKHVIVVNDGAGFFTTRVLGAYLHEALILLRGGASIGAIDAALEDFGFALGPMALLDEVGIDTAHEIAATLEDAFGDRLRTSEIAAQLVAFGRRGRKSGRGLYEYLDGKRGEPDGAVYDLLELEPREDAFDADTIAWRCVLRFVDEAVRCFADGVLRSSRDGDAGAVFGLGFPPFRGGPFRMVATRGAGELVERMDHYGLEVGPLLREMARRGTSLADAREATQPIAP